MTDYEFQLAMQALVDVRMTVMIVGYLRFSSWIVALYSIIVRWYRTILYPHYCCSYMLFLSYIISCWFSSPVLEPSFLVLAAVGLTNPGLFPDCLRPTRWIFQTWLGGCASVPDHARNCGKVYLSTLLSCTVDSRFYLSISCFPYDYLSWCCFIVTCLWTWDRI